MAADQFCLRWNNFQSNIVSVLDNLKEEEDLVDVTLVCEGHAVKAHKVILSACSPYFRNVFKENPCQHPIVILKDVHNTELEALLNFMYQGEVYISQDRLSSFLRTAEILQVRGLTGASAPVHQADLGQPMTASTSAVAQPRTNASQRNTNRTSTRPTNSPPPLIPPSSIQQRDSSPPQVKRRKTTPRRAIPATPPKDITLEDNQLVVTKQEPIDEEELGICREEDFKQDISAEEDDDGEDGYLPQPASGSQSPLASDESTSMLARSLTAPRNTDAAGSNSPLQNLLLGGSVEGTLAIGDQQLSPGLASTASLAAILRPLGAGFSDTASSTSSKGTCRRPSVCPLCNRTFSNHFNMKQHIMNVHVPPVPAQCPKCNCTVRNRLYLRKHLVKAHNVPLRRVFDSQGRRVYVNSRNSSI